METRAVMKTASEAMRNKASVISFNTPNNGSLSRTHHSSSPLVSRVYQARMACMNRCIQCAINSMGVETETIQFQLLVLGCGHDSSYSEYHHTTKSICHTFLVDFDEIIKTRREANTYQTSKTEYLIGADLRAPEELLEKLNEGSPFSLLLPTVVIFESVLSYIDKNTVQKLLTLLQRDLSTCLTLIYDPLLTLSSTNPPQTCRFEELSHAMESTFRSRQVPIRFACRSTAEMRQFLHRCCFEHTLSMTMHQILTACFSQQSSPESPILGARSGVEMLVSEKECQNSQSSALLSHRSPTTSAEPFDEFASLAALHRIYAISCSCNTQAMFDHFVHNLFGNDSKSIEKYTSRKTWHVVGSQYIIRQATTQDVDVMAEIFSESHVEFVTKYKSVRAHIKHSRQLIYDTFLKSDPKAPQANRYFYVAEDLGTHSVVGCVAFSFTCQGKVGSALTDTKLRGQLSHLCVDKQFRKRGVGSSLVEEVMKHAATVPSCEQVELTTLLDMHEARQLYQSKKFLEKDMTNIGENCQLVHMLRPIAI